MGYPGENEERMLEDAQRETALLRVALTALLNMTGGINWTEGQEGDGYRHAERVYRATIHLDTYAKLRRAVHQATLAEQGKSLEDEAIEQRQEAVRIAQENLRRAQEALQKAQQEAAQ